MRAPAPSKAKSLSLPVTPLRSRSLAMLRIDFKVQQLPSHPLPVLHKHEGGGRDSS